jgi:hypothetical protein
MLLLLKKCPVYEIDSPHEGYGPVGILTCPKLETV